MYKFRKNKETQRLEIVNTIMNVHPSIIDKVEFDRIFTREAARWQYFSLLAKIENGTVTKSEDYEKCDLLEEKYHFPKTDDSTDLTDCDAAIIPLMALTLFAHEKLLKEFVYEQKEDGTGEWKAKKAFLTFDVSKLFNECKKWVSIVEDQPVKIEEAIKAIKPLYNEATNLVNHEAVEGVCKKWTASTKEKITRLFFIGLLPSYNVDSHNYIKRINPLRSIDRFRTYFAMWLVTDGKIKDEKKTGKKVEETFDSFNARAIKAREKKLAAEEARKQEIEAMKKAEEEKKRTVLREVKKFKELPKTADKESKTGVTLDEKEEAKAEK